MQQSNFRPSVCVVIPCFNHGQFIRDAVSSATAQTYSAVEIIVIDDGSDDPKTIKVLNDIEPHINGLIRINNSGPSAARNTGIEATAAQYILPLDADDVIGPYYVECGARVLDERKDVGIVYSHAEFFGDRGGPWELPDYNFPDILLDNCIFSAMLFRRSDWAAVGGYKTNMSAGWEDYDFVLSLIERGVNVVRLPGTHFYYRALETSRNRRMNSKQYVRAYVQLFRNHEQLYCDHIETIFREIYELRHRRAEINKLNRRLPILVREAVSAHKAHEQITSQYREENKRLRQQIRYMESSVPSRTVRLIKYLLRRVVGDSESDYSNSQVVTYKSYDDWFWGWNGGPSPFGNNRTPIDNGPLVSVIVLPGSDRTWAEAISWTTGSISAQSYTCREVVIVSWTDGVLDAHHDIPADGTYCVVEPGLCWSDVLAQSVSRSHGDYVIFIEAGDQLHIDALDELVRYVQLHDADLLYVDEDELSHSRRHTRPWFKPDFDAEHMLGCNIIGQGVMATRALIRSNLIGNAMGRDESWYDLVLRMSEQAKFIVHVRRVLYHRNASLSEKRANVDVASVNTETTTVVCDALMRRNIAGTVEPIAATDCHRIRRRIVATPPVALILVVDGDMTTLSTWIEQLAMQCDYSNLKWVVVGTDDLLNDLKPSMDDKSAVLQSVEKSATIVERLQRGVQCSDSEFVAVCGQHVTPITPDWIYYLLAHAWNPGTGVVGGRILDSSERTLEAGIAICKGGGIGFPHRGTPRRTGGYRNRALVSKHVSALGASLMLVNRQHLEDIGGFDTRHFTSAWHDIDLCLRLIEAGKINMYTPWAEAIVSDKRYAVPTMTDPMEPWQAWFCARHEALCRAGDPYYRTEAQRLIGDGELI